MAIRTGTTSVEVATSLRTTYTTPLLTQIAAGNTVLASHLTTLKNFINAVAPHTHTLTDYSKIYEFGNTGSTLSSVKTVSAVTGATVSSTYATGALISAAHYTELRNAVEVLRSHSHAWDDTTA